jgi:hypothetical protein
MLECREKPRTQCPQAQDTHIAPLDLKSTDQTSLKSRRRGDISLTLWWRGKMLAGFCFIIRLL